MERTEIKGCRFLDAGTTTMVATVTSSVPPAAQAVRDTTPPVGGGPSGANAPPTVSARGDGQDIGPQAHDKKKSDDKSLDQLSFQAIAADSRLAIQQDDVIRRFIYKFVNSKSGDVIRQYPHQMVVDSLHSIDAAVQRFLDRKV